jgi:hypothetical protein
VLGTGRRNGNMRLFGLTLIKANAGSSAPVGRSE